VEDICNALGVSKSSCYRWHHIFDELGTVKKPLSPLKGPTRIITRALLTAIEDLFIEDSDLFLDEVCTWLAFEHQITISTSTLSRNLTEAGLTRKILRKFACERDEVRREEFRASLRNDFIGDGSEFVVVDETNKNDCTYARHYGRTSRGHCARLSDVFVGGDRYSLCAAMTTQGYLTCHVVEGSFDVQEFYDFIIEDVVNISL